MYYVSIDTGIHLISNCQLPAVSVLFVLACQTLVFNSLYIIYTSFNLKEFDKICDRHQMQNVRHQLSGDRHFGRHHFWHYFQTCYHNAIRNIDNQARVRPRTYIPVNY